MSERLPGLVVRQHGRHVWVESPSGARCICHSRGKKNDCVVGDRVLWEPSLAEGAIAQVLPRQSLLYRQDDLRTKQFAANMDQVLLVVAAEPLFSEVLLFRALVACAAARIKVRILLNKCDLAPSFAAAQVRLVPYEAMGYAVDALSITHDPERAQHLLQSLLLEAAPCATLVLGASGVGKSSLVNLMIPSAKVPTQTLSEALQSGRHTTTQTTWYWLDEARTCALVDSPGVQAFGLHHIDRAALPQLMPDFALYVGQCKFYNCTHLHEPQCAILAAVQAGAISPKRHQIYERLFKELGQARF